MNIEDWRELAGSSKLKAFLQLLLLVAFNNLQNVIESQNWELEETSTTIPL